MMLLYVLQSEGSSPGRKGFKMAVAADGEINGTIGGGIMEYKLVEKAKDMLLKNVMTSCLMKQYHDKQHISGQSGMICSGSQLNAFLPITLKDLSIIEEIISGKNTTLFLSHNGIETGNSDVSEFKQLNNEEWNYSELLNEQPVIHIIGGGHVALALSELMHYLGFYIKLYDDRPELNTLNDNSFADEMQIVDYECISSSINSSPGDYAVIMTIGYRTDKTVLKQIMDKPFFYLGLLGSKHKIDSLFSELIAEGYAEEKLKKVHAPIGLSIASKTAREIAVSIAGEIILKKNSVDL